MNKPNWDYYICRNGWLYKENGERVPFDGQERDDVEWEAYFEKHSIRASVKGLV